MKTITAEQARLLRFHARFPMLDDIMCRIEWAAEEGAVGLDVEHLPPEVITFLQGLGYFIEAAQDDARPEFAHTISWRL